MPVNRDTMLRVIVCVHFVLISMVFITEWLPISYQLSQITILALGFWAIVHRESAAQVELLMLVEFFSIVLDSVAIGMYFQIGKRSHDITKSTASFVISAIFAILHLILKPIIIFLLNKVREERLNNASFGAWGPASGYTSVDER